MINAGDGAHEHPTQALLDLLTVLEEKGRIDGLTVTIVGDVLHSRVARSNIYGFQKLGRRGARRGAADDDPGWASRRSASRWSRGCARPSTAPTW